MKSTESKTSLTFYHIYSALQVCPIVSVTHNFIQLSLILKDGKKPPAPKAVAEEMGVGITCPTFPRLLAKVERKA